MRGVYGTHLGRNIPAVLMATVVLAGCGKNQDLDALKADTGQQKQQLATLRAEADQQKQRISELNLKISALEDTVRDLKPKPQKALATSGAQQLSITQTAALRKVIVQCVQTVRALAPPGATPINDVHLSFDAYYNPASGRVENNNRYVIQDAVYAFNKCMTEQGWPLH
jgi:outer membrane murein-binding lipoprotein Lpp